MAQVSLKGVNKSFGATHVIKDVDLEIEKGEFVSAPLAAVNLLCSA